MTVSSSNRSMPIGVLIWEQTSTNNSATYSEILSKFIFHTKHLFVKGCAQGYILFHIILPESTRIGKGAGEWKGLREREVSKRHIETS